MTISSDISKVQYTANGVLVTFIYPFKIFNDTDLVVISTVDGVDTTETNYTVTGAGSDTGGTVVFNTAPADETIITIKRVMEVTQETDYVENSPFPAESHEDALDKLTMIAQQQDEDIDRSLKYPISDPVIGTNVPSQDDRATFLLGFDADGAPRVSDSTVDEVDATVAAAREEGTLISSDSFTGDGVTVAYNISVIPINKFALLVQVGGATQEPTAYDVAGYIVTFTEAPGDGVPFTIRNLGYQVAAITSTAATTSYVPYLGTTRTVQDRLRTTKYLSDYTDLATALSVIGSTESLLVIDEAFTLTANATVLATTALEWRPNSLASGAYTLTINGSLEPGVYQLFESDITIAGTFKPDIYWWGVKFDGSTDDTVTFDKVLAYMQGDIGGGIVELPYGTMNVSSIDLIDDNSKSIILKGKGKNATTINITATTGTGIRVRNSNSRLQDFTLDGPGSGTGDGVYLKDTSGTTPKNSCIKNVIIQDFGGAGFANDGFANWFEGVVSQRNDVGYSDEGSGGTTTLRNCFIVDNTTYGIAFGGALKQILLDVCNIELNGTGLFSGASSGGVENILINSCHFEGNTDRDIRLGNGTKDCIINGGRFAGINSRTNNTITHVGDSSGRFRLYINGPSFTDEGSGSNTEIISAGENVEVILVNSDAIGNGINTSNITLAATANIVTTGTIGKNNNQSVSGAVTLDYEDGSYVTLTLTGNITNMATPSNVIVGKQYAIRFIQGGSGSYTTAFGTSYKNAPTVRSGAAGTTHMTTWIGVGPTTLDFIG